MELNNEKEEIILCALGHYCFWYCRIFFWAIWNAGLKDFATWRWSYFTDYKSFSKKVQMGHMTEDLPESAKNVKYYYGNRKFVKVAGYGSDLSEAEYVQAKEKAIQRYQLYFNSSNAVASEERYMYSDDTEIQWLDKNYLTLHDIEECEKLLLEKENIKDYYILASEDYYGGPINYYDCVLCNDKTGRMIELSKVDRNPN